MQTASMRQKASNGKTTNANANENDDDGMVTMVGMVGR